MSCPVMSVLRAWPLWHGTLVKLQIYRSLLRRCMVPQVLQDFQENPQAAQRHLKNPMIMEKLQKLINAGIVRMA